MIQLRAELGCCNLGQCGANKGNLSPMEQLFHMVSIQSVEHKSNQAKEDLFLSKCEIAPLVILCSSWRYSWRLTIFLSRELMGSLTREQILNSHSLHTVFSPMYYCITLSKLSLLFFFLRLFLHFHMECFFGLQGELKIVIQICYSVSTTFNKLSIQENRCTRIRKVEGMAT